MRPLSLRVRLILAVGCILCVGFVAVNFVNYHIARKTMRNTLVRAELPLTSNNIYSEIQTGLLQPIYVSSLMANDTFLKDWMLDGEQSRTAVQRYLGEIHDKYDVFSVFLVSALTHRYYHFSGVLKEVDPAQPKDRWFFSMKDHGGNYRIDIDHNEAANLDLTLFINHKVFDHDGAFIGVTGVGLNMRGIAALIDEYMTTYGRDIYFVGRDGVMRSHSEAALVGRANIHEMAGISAVAGELLASDHGGTHYHRDGDRILLTYRYIPELDWYLIVEQSEQKVMEPLRRAFYTSQGVSLLIIALVLVITAFTINRFQRQLENLARYDKVTGAHNRQYFDLLAGHSIKRARRDRTPLALLVFDIDRFKELNDRHGHATGDRVLADIAACARRVVRESDLVGRWGGDEFVVLMPGCNTAGAIEVAEKLRAAVAALGSTGDIPPVTISAGAAEWNGADDLDDLVARADEQLYIAKRQGRDRTAG